MTEFQVGCAIGAIAMGWVMVIVLAILGPRWSDRG